MKTARGDKKWLNKEEPVFREGEEDKKEKKVGEVCVCVNGIQGEKAMVIS